MTARDLPASPRMTQPIAIVTAPCRRRAGGIRRRLHRLLSSPRHASRGTQTALAVMLATLLLGAAVEATKIHKLYEDAGSFFGTQLNKQVITDATHIYVLLDNDDG